MKDNEPTSSSLQAFRKLLTSDDFKNIPSGIDANEYISRFLRFKADPPRAYETFVRYHKFRNSEKEMFSKMCPSTMKHLIDSKIITKLPGKDSEGRPVILVCCKRWDVNKVSAEEIILLIILFFEEINRSHESSVSVVIDWETYGFVHYRQLTFRNLTRSFALIKGAIPISFKGIHQVYQSNIFWLVSKILFSLMPSKLKSRMHLHGTDRQSLAAHIPTSSLTADYGGSSEEDVDSVFMDKCTKMKSIMNILQNFVKWKHTKSQRYGLYASSYIFANPFLLLYGHVYCYYNLT